MVDAWSFRPSDPGDKNYANPRKNNKNMKMAETRTGFAADRRHLIKALSTDAAAQFEMLRSIGSTWTRYTQRKQCFKI